MDGDGFENAHQAKMDPVFAFALRTAAGEIFVIKIFTQVTHGVNYIFFGLTWQIRLFIMSKYCELHYCVGPLV
jgi:hypothetical protein